METLPEPRLEHLYYIEVEVEKGHRIGRLPEGDASAVPIIGGRFEGGRMSGTVLSFGADWNSMRPGPKVRISTRYVLKTDDGAIISLNTDGRGVFGLKAMPGFMTGKPDPSAIYFRQHLIFRTGSAKYAWLNDALAFAVVGLDAKRRVCYDAYMIA